MRFSLNRKTMYITLSVLMIFIFTLSIAYAALSVTLNISGNAEITATDWDLYLTNAKVSDGSITSTIPTISNKVTANFSVTLSNPGEFYEFTIEVKNDGDIDAMIQSITKNPTLTELQAKYLNYVIDYENGESITEKQLVKAGKFVRLRVRLEFRKDVSASDLPTVAETLNLSFVVNYVQSDESGTPVKSDGVYKVAQVISGTGMNMGDEIKIGDEEFSVISNDGSYITMITKYNLQIGKYCTSDYSPNHCIDIMNPTGLQDRNPSYSTSEGVHRYAAINFLSDVETGYYGFFDLTGGYPSVYTFNYSYYLSETFHIQNETRLLSMSDFELMGCPIYEHEFSCDVNMFLGNDPFWIGVGHGDTSEAPYNVLYVESNSNCFVGTDDENEEIQCNASLNGYPMSPTDYYGVHPVVVISSDEI